MVSAIGFIWFGNSDGGWWGCGMVLSEYTDEAQQVLRADRNRECLRLRFSDDVFFEEHDEETKENALGRPKAFLQ